MKIGIIGALGFIGKSIALTLKKDFEIIEITKSNYRSHVGEEFDVLINANGNSTKFLANRYPERDFKASVTTVVNSLYDFTFDKYIYISSIDVEKANIGNVYGSNRYLAEQVVSKYINNWVIVRCCAVIGKDARKGIVNDIMTDQEVYLTPDSKLQLITASEVASQVEKCLYAKRNEIIRLYSKTNISVKVIAGILKKELHINKDAKKVIYDYRVKDNELKTSIQYLKEII